MMKGRPKRDLNVERILAAILKFKHELVLKDDNFPPKSDVVWSNISASVNHEKTPLAVYSIVYKNYYNVWEKLGISSRIKKDSQGSLQTPDWPLEELTHPDSSSGGCSDISSDEAETLKFDLTISAAEYEKMAPQQHNYARREEGRIYGVRRYQIFEPRTWTHVIMSNFQKSTKLPCNLVFKRAKLSLTNSSENFANIKATCRDCKSVLKGFIRQTPENASHVVIECSYNGSFKTPHNSPSKRHLSGLRRKEIVSKIVNEKLAPSVFRRMEAHSSMSFGDAIPPTLPSAGVLRVAVHEARAKGRLHSDPVRALTDAMDIVPFQGVIRDIGIRRFFVHYWSSSQVHVYRSYCDDTRQCSQISIDATGGVVKRLQHSCGEKSQHLFLYEVTVNDNIASQQYSVCNMISERQDANSIHYWLTEWKRSGAVAPKVIVTDMSAALMTAVVSAFTEFKTTTEYLAKCAMILHDDRESSFEVPACFIRCDIAHTVKLMTKWTCLNGQIKRTRQFYLRAMCQVLQSTSLDDIKMLLTAIFTVAYSETEGRDINSEEPTICATSKKMLQLRIATGLPTDTIEDIVNSPPATSRHAPDVIDEPIELSEGLCQDNDITSNTFPTFKEWVIKLAVEGEENAQQEGDVGNQQYLPGIVKHICHLMRLLPCCTAVMVPIFKYGQIAASSAPVESSFNDLKSRIFANMNLPLRVDDFVFHHIKVIDGTMKIACTSSIVEETNSNHDLEQQSSNEDCRGDVVPVSTDPSSQAMCSACKDGNFPMGAHTCKYCGVAVHVLPGCSLPIDTPDIADANEGYGEKRMCINCSKKNAVEQRSTAELQEYENWRNLGVPPKKRPRRSYMEPQSEWQSMNLTDPRPVIPIGVVKNGNKLKPIRRLKQRIHLSNTCAFDSLLQLTAITFCDSVQMKAVINNETLPLFQIASLLVKDGVKQNVYNMRANIITQLFDSETLLSGITRVDCVLSVDAMIKRLLTSFPSVTETVTCNSVHCPKKQRVIDHAVCAVQWSTDTIDQLQFSIVSELSAVRLTECKARISSTNGMSSDDFTVTPDTGVAQCAGICGRTYQLSEYHFYIEPISLGTEIGIVDTVPEVKLGLIPTRMELAGNVYWLRGVSGYTGELTPNSVGHYIAFGRRHDSQWEAYDDLKEGKSAVSPNRVVRAALLYYTIG